MASAPRFRIDVAIHDLLIRSNPLPPIAPQTVGATLPEPIFPQYPEKLKDPGHEVVLERRAWSREHIYRAMRGGLFPYIRSRVMPGDFQVNSVQRLQEMKAFIRMVSGADLRKIGWYGDGRQSNGDIHELRSSMPGIVHENGQYHFADWSCRAGQNNVIIRTDGTIAPCFPMYAATHDLGEHRSAQVRPEAAIRNAADMPATLFFYAQPQPQLLLQRFTRDQVALEAS